MRLQFLYVTLSLLVVNVIAAQENEKLIEQEESAEVFLEEYTDEFQETFFEALKQKGIQNYDRATNLLLKCKLLKPDDAAIDHELAKVNLLDKKFIVAEQYAIEALISEPENFWFLNTLNTILEQQGNTLEMKKQSIPFDNPKLQENLAEIYFQSKRYTAALDLVKTLSKTERTKELLLKINDSLDKMKRVSKSQPSVKNTISDSSEKSNPVEETKSKIDTAISNMDYEEANKLANEAVEEYPLQPYFYYALGLTHNQKSMYNEAIEILETGLDYIFDDQEMSNRFYEELARANKAIGNTSRANEYLAKIKTGS